MPDYLNQLVAYWKRQSIGPATSRPTVSELAAWEHHNAVKLSSDLREYFLHVNGTHKGEQLEFGNDLMTFLPLHAVVPEGEWSKREGRPGHFAIVDHCISCYWWTALLTTEAQQTTSIFLEGRRVAPSFEEFVWLYVTESKQIHTSSVSG